MSKKNEVHEAEVVEEKTEAQSQSEVVAIRSRKILTMTQFVPDKDWINKNVVGKGKGHKETVGRVYGYVTNTKEKEGLAPDGITPLKSLALVGMFEAVNVLTGELSEAGVVYLPLSFAERIATMFAMDEALKTVQIDVDVALEATGKTIPYTWVITNYVENEAANPLLAMRKARGTPALTGPTKRAQIEAPKE